MVAKLNNMQLRARLVVEGYMIGYHKSPYHGFSVEFAEHRSYGHGDEVRQIDWKCMGKQIVIMSNDLKKKQMSVLIFY